MADIKKLKDQIWYAKKELADAEKLRDDYVKQRDDAKQLLADDPDNDEMISIVADVEKELAGLEAVVTKEATKVAGLEASLPDEFKKPAGPKFDPEKHPLLKKTLEKAEPAQPVIFNTGDICEAYWPSDRSWYKAKIMSILGSASNPKYHVKYVDYDDTKTLDPEHVRLPQTKRKREEVPTPAAATPHVSNVGSNSNAASQSNQDGSAEPQRKKKKKAPGTKVLERKAANWKAFTAKGVGKKAIGDSMFRTGDAINARVGVIGSGAGMTESTKRVRHDKKLDERLDKEAERREQEAERREQDAEFESRRFEAPRGRRDAGDNGRPRYSPPRHSRRYF